MPKRTATVAVAAAEEQQVAPAAKITKRESKKKSKVTEKVTCIGENRYFKISTNRVIFVFLQTERFASLNF